VTRVVDTPYRIQAIGSKGSIFYRTHSYHTKVPPEGIVPMIEHYTDPGDTVLDPFCGSGMTGVAAMLSGRRGVLSDLSPAAVHIARGNIAAPDPISVASAADQLLHELEALEWELYGTVCAQCSGAARIEYTVWSDTIACPACDHIALYWDAARLGDGTLSKTLTCLNCAHQFRKADGAIGTAQPVLVSVACKSCGVREQRSLSSDELLAATRARRSEITDWYPTAPLESWREMWRGQHRKMGIESAADFFTDRNLMALAAVWAAAGRSNDRQILRFAVTAIVNRASKRYQWNPKRPTNVLSGTLYIASLTYEFNVFSLLRRKLAAVRQLAVAQASTSGSSSVVQRSATNLKAVSDSSIDYVFTDPPFGANIYYSDASFLWEAWLDDFTLTSEEAIVSTSLSSEHGGKSLSDYEGLMTESFVEIQRVLKPEAWTSVMFHNSDDAVWSSLERSLESAGLVLESAIAFDKGQPSFKGVKQITNQERVSSFDLVLHLRSGKSGLKTRTRRDESSSSKQLISAIAAHLLTASPRLRTTPYLHSFVMRLLLENGWALTGYSYTEVSRLLDEHFTEKDHVWANREKPHEYAHSSTTEMDAN
jgi:DNA modification methylase